jgi:hypothetical protein
MSFHPSVHSSKSIINNHESKKKQKKSNVTETSDFLPEITPISSAKGSLSYPILLDEDETVTSISPMVQTHRPCMKSDDRNQKFEHQVILDVTGDESPRISVKTLSLCESQRRPSGHNGVHSKEAQFSSPQHSSSRSHGANAVVSSQRTSSPDVIEINARITTKSKRGIFKTEYTGCCRSWTDP